MFYSFLCASLFFVCFPSFAKTAFNTLLKLKLLNPFSFVFASATRDNGVAVYRRRHDNTLEASQVGHFNVKK